MTREIPLTRGFVALVDDEDHDRVIAAGPWHAHLSGRTVYAKHTIDRFGRRGSIFLHSLISGWPYVDHTNGDGLDNRRVNLRPSEPELNAANRRTRSDSTSGLKGVFPNPYRGRPWRAQICVQGAKRHLGLFDTPEDAARAYDAAAVDAWGIHARPNFPQEYLNASA